MRKEPTEFAVRFLTFMMSARGPVAYVVAVPVGIFIIIYSVTLLK